MSESLYLSWFHILAELSLSEQMDGRRYRGRQRETRPDVPRLPTEVQLSEGWRESRRGAKSGEKTSLSGTQVESRFIPEPAHARCQRLSSGGGGTALLLHSFHCPHAFALSSWLLSLPPPQSGAWMNKSLHLPSPHQLCSRSLYLFSPPIK